MSTWIDLLDPTEEELRAQLPADVHVRVVEEMLRPPVLDPNTRPQLKGFGDHVFGILLLAVVDTARNLLFYQEVDVFVTRSHIVTVRKTPPGEQPYDVSDVKETCAAARGHVPPGMVLYYLLDDIAERYLDTLDDAAGEIDELEENLDTWPPEQVQRRVSELRRGLLRVRRTLSPTRDAVRGIVDGRIDIDGGLLRREVFPESVERAFAVVLDKLLRATESLDFLRDLLGAARDYHATQLATEQNEVVKRLAVVASLLLVPTFIVGVYGQNFDHMPEVHWYLGYLYSWGLIVATTVAQLVFFRWKKWI